MYEKLYISESRNFWKVFSSNIHVHYRIW